MYAQIEETAILVQIITDKQADITAKIDEFKHLAQSAGLKVNAVMKQNRKKPDPRWLIGKGKAAELQAEVEKCGADAVVFGCELTPAQVRNLEQIISAKILDRTQLILDIFAQRARTREGKIQVELAQLTYLLPRLSGHGTHLSRLGGGIGTRGPGETKLETDRRHIRKRMTDLKSRLQVVVRHRKLHRKRRKKQGVFQVALAGYTNAGKSTLLRQLTRSDVLAENRLFATLDPTSKGLQLPSGHEIVLTDTVGFIQDLPHELVAAFRATLEEVCEADLILHVIDAASPTREQQIAVVEKVLLDLGVTNKEILQVYNKSDLLDETHSLGVSSANAVWISAFDSKDLEKLKQEIQHRLLKQIVTFKIPLSEGDIIAQLHEVGEVVDSHIDDQEETIHFTVRIHPPTYERMSKKFAPYKEIDI